jgi:hypothetical protein
MSKLQHNEAEVTGCYSVEKKQIKIQGVVDGNALWMWCVG